MEEMPGTRCARREEEPLSPLGVPPSRHLDSFAEQELLFRIALFRCHACSIMSARLMTALAVGGQLSLSPPSPLSLRSQAGLKVPNFESRLHLSPEAIQGPARATKVRVTSVKDVSVTFTTQKIPRVLGAWCPEMKTKSRYLSVMAQDVLNKCNSVDMNTCQKSVQQTNVDIATEPQADCDLQCVLPATDERVYLFRIYIDLEIFSFAILYINPMFSRMLHPIIVSILQNKSKILEQPLENEY